MLLKLQLLWDVTVCHQSRSWCSEEPHCVYLNRYVVLFGLLDTEVESSVIVWNISCQPSVTVTSWKTWSYTEKSLMNLLMLFQWH